MNTIMITGRLKEDAVHKITNSGKHILSFTTADDYGFGDNKNTNWWNCTLWGNLGPVIMDSMTKGKDVTVSGEVETNTWEDKNGNKRSDKIINVRNIKLHGKVDDKKPHKEQKESPPMVSNIPFSDEDIPF